MGITVPLKSKLTVSTRSSKLDSCVSNVETFEFRDVRIEDQGSSIKNQETTYANSKKFEETIYPSNKQQ